MKLTRRDFLRGMAVCSAIGVAPRFLTQTAHAAERTIEGFADGKILVVVQLGGGNDGLNTLVPHSNDAYYRARPSIGLKGEQLLKLNDDLALNSAAEGFMRLYDAGQLSIIQNVGYPNPDRSHFRSMEIWETASDADEYLGYGWLGRYFDNTCGGTAMPQAGMALGGERPQAFDGRRGFGISTTAPERFGWTPGFAGDTADVFEKLNAANATQNETLDFLRHTTQSAIMSAAQVREAAQRGNVQSGANYKNNGLEMVAGLIRGNLDTKIYYVNYGGFDTHANQLTAHDRLWKEVSEDLLSFQKQLAADGNDGRVLTMVFSEFGRRVGENASGGTDHGTAAPMFIVGNAAKPGIHGGMPVLDDLDDGDLKYGTDFRSVYATLLENWLDTPQGAVLGRNFETLDLIKKA